MVLASRGEFSPGAPSIKRLRKTVYIWLAKRMIFTRVSVATPLPNATEYEVRDILRTISRNPTVYIARPVIAEGK
jgi:hypothetical protein